MDDGKRRTRFEGRVQLERMFLTPVNSVFGPVEPLSGMTKDAIDSWEIRASCKAAPKKVQEIARILLEASSRAHLLADNSKEVFEPDRRPKIDSVEELHSMLESSLMALR